MRPNTELKVRKFVDAYLETGNISLSAMLAGSQAKDTASLYETGKKWLEKSGLSVKDLQEMNGITDQHLVNKLKDGLDATKKYYGSWQGEIVESEPYDDQPTRLKALELAHRLRGELIDRKELSGKDGGDLILQVSPRVPGDKAKHTLEIE